MSSIPFVEKYRPIDLLSMQYNEYNKKFLQNSLVLNKISNMIFYGPPGTGKTTVIINFVNEYFKRNNLMNKGLLLHLNASDDRGIDVIRNSILRFVTSDGILSNSLKFVILDEADYMTKAAQKMLQSIMETSYKQVRIFMICNYISKIDTTLISEFIILRFHQLSKEIINDILSNIILKEKLDISKTQVNDIQEYYKSDIRSMINSIQYKSIHNIPNSDIYRNLYMIIKRQNVKELQDNMNLYAKNLNYTANNLIFMLIEYLIHTDKNITSEFIVFAEMIYTTKNSNNCIMDYASHYLCNYYKN
jgi:DNA polymerase III delta prime subunit